MRPQKPHVEIAAANPRRGGVVLVMVLVACVLILSAQAPVRGGRGTVLQSWILSASAPVAAAVGAALARRVERRSLRPARSSTRREENERLRSDLDARERELFRLRAEARAGRREPPHARAGRVAAGQSSAAFPILLIEHRAGVHERLIGAGSADGVVPGSPLAVPAGLVGRVVTVGRGVSRAQLLLDASAAAGARIARTGELGVVRGDGHGALILNNIATTSSVARGRPRSSRPGSTASIRAASRSAASSRCRAAASSFSRSGCAPTADFSRLTDVLLLAPSPAVAGEPRRPAKGAPR